ncbi:thioesterase II family protein [Streptomyces sp. NPDC102405]|uniref:thioesterase II family protein n=1 Tax=Streptomyces sp. NPDC102405 TaxID=3366170 RepID=UPI003814F672
MRNRALKDLTGRHDAACHLVCFPYGGGGPSTFRTWPAGLPRQAGVWAANLAGREGRFAEPPLTDLRQQVEELAAAVRPLSDRPLVLFGASLGATLAAHVAQEIFPAMSAPATLVVAARRAPWSPSPPSRRFAHLPDADFLDALAEGGGIDTRVRNSPELLELVMPVLRADAHLAEAEQYVKEKALNGCVHGFYGLADAAVDRAETEQWQRFTTGTFQAVGIEGGHFFATTRQADMLSHLRRILTGSLSSPSIP